MHVGARIGDLDLEFGTFGLDPGNFILAGPKGFQQVCLGRKVLFFGDGIGADKEEAQAAADSIPDKENLTTKEELQKSFGEVNAEISSLRGEVKAEISGLRGDFKTEISGLRGDFKTEISGLRGEVKAESSGLRGEFKAESSGLRGEFKTEISSLRGEVRADMAVLKYAYGPVIVALLIKIAFFS